VTLPKKGPLSLAIATTGMLLLAAGLKTEILQHTAWYVLLAGFEAAVVGGCADWFAVRALFAEIPIPFIRKHTNIIVKSRAKISNGIVDLVSNEWLSKESLTEKIAAVSIADKLLELLQESAHKTKIIGFLQAGILRLSKASDFSKLAPYLEKMLKKELQGVEFGKPMGIWLQKIVHNQEHTELWQVAFSSVSKTVNSMETRAMIIENVAKQADTIKSGGFLKRLAVGAAQALGGMDSETVADKILTSINELLAELKTNQQHPLRQKLEGQLLDFAHRLENGDAAANDLIKNMQAKLVANVESKAIIAKFLVSIQEKLEGQLEDNQSFLMRFMQRQTNQIVASLATNKKWLAKADVFLKSGLVSVINKNHHLIAHTVSDSLGKLDNHDLVKQIEDKVGDDLQYIRLNGAIVGGVVGIVLYVLRTFVLDL